MTSANSEGRRNAPASCYVQDPRADRRQRLIRDIQSLGVDRVHTLQTPGMLNLHGAPVFLHNDTPDRDAAVATVRNGGSACVLVFGRNWSREKAAAQAHAAGAEDFLIAPVGREELSLCLARHAEPAAAVATPASATANAGELQSRIALLNSRLDYYARFDTLTGLPNRKSLELHAANALRAAGGSPQGIALLHLDVNGLKLVNTWEGYSAGDRLLSKIAQVVEDASGSARVGRITSDEFGILLTESSERRAVEIAEHLRQVISAVRFQRNGNAYPVGASLGVALAESGDALDVRGLFTRAEQACYVAKRHGRNIVHLYNEDDLEILDQQLATHWVPRIRQALAEDRFKLVFQPVLRLANQQVDHYEVLIRMVDDDGNYMPPAEFIRVAEKTGLIHDIDRWVVQEAIDVLRRVSKFNNQLSLNVNLSGHAFEDPLLVPMVRERLANSGVDAGRITFEITETAAVSNYEKTREMVSQLRDLGCRFALDDFGAGFNSYNYLKQFPVDFLKIDGSFITNLARDPVDQALVKSMAEIARTLGKQTVAEFVGNAETMDLLRSYHIDCAQGFFIGKPAPNIPLSNLMQESENLLVH